MKVYLNKQDIVNTLQALNFRYIWLFMSKDINKRLKQALKEAQSTKLINNRLIIQMPIKEVQNMVRATWLLYCDGRKGLLKEIPFFDYRKFSKLKTPSKSALKKTVFALMVSLQNAMFKHVYTTTSDKDITELINTHDIYLGTSVYPQQRQEITQKLIKFYRNIQRDEKNKFKGKHHSKKYIANQKSKIVDGHMLQLAHNWMLGNHGDVITLDLMSTIIMATISRYSSRYFQHISAVFYTLNSLKDTLHTLKVVLSKANYHQDRLRAGIKDIKQRIKAYKKVDDKGLYFVKYTPSLDYKSYTLSRVKLPDLKKFIELTIYETNYNDWFVPKHVLKGQSLYFDKMSL